MTKNSFRTPATVIQTYRTFQILLNDFNDATMEFFQIVLNNTVIGTIVLNVCVLVRFHSRLELGSSLLFSICSACGISFILLTYIQFGDINIRSGRVLSSWKRWDGYESSGDRNLMMAYMVSSQALKIHLGGFGYYKKPNTIRIIGKLIYYTAKFLLMTKNFH